MPAKKIDHNHIKPPPDIDLPRTIHEDLHRLGQAEVPIITISATFRQDIAEHLGERAKSLEEAVFSRAHFSMSIAVLEEAARRKLSSWLVDPTNYVSKTDWNKILFTEWTAEKIARNPLLKKVKDFVDTFARSRLPISQAVREPLEYVTSDVKTPIVSMHYEPGNLLAELGKEVLQVVTDPHVRINYLLQAQRKNITFAVFDTKTQKEFLTKAHKMGKGIDESRVIVTGPPVDPRIVEARRGKSAARGKKPLRLVITTGGLGTNKGEIKKILEEILPWVKRNKAQVVLYAGTHHDFAELYKNMAWKHGIDISATKNDKAALRIIHETSIIKANKRLIDYAFSWAEGFVTKPSGDMAYDAVAAGCFVLSLEPWGEWEKNIERVFAEKGVLQKAEPGSFANQLDGLFESGWIKKAIENALKIDELFLRGAKKIVDLQQKLALQ